jgi:hypothetical protein
LHFWERQSSQKSDLGTVWEDCNRSSKSEGFCS